ncbi:MAG TPA: hypothetical protein VGO47_00290, partial [Chlamydiales bacterium]|nr:hypothetical protein [Chlamydiales bacterium]
MPFSTRWLHVVLLTAQGSAAHTHPIYLSTCTRRYQYRVLSLRPSPSLSPMYWNTRAASQSLCSHSNSKTHTLYLKKERKKKK